jgi:hypothetical protein
MHIVRRQLWGDGGARQQAAAGSPTTLKIELPAMELEEINAKTKCRR